ncbi:unnamed protein product [marine sediment metagenome]|uniref:Uncharacterized protein n=1 Tax=marine sediment metagenome TaxID=412755 RepID=X0WDI4_9ZZZZ
MLNATTHDGAARQDGTRHHITGPDEAAKLDYTTLYRKDTPMPHPPPERATSPPGTITLGELRGLLPRDVKWPNGRRKFHYYLIAGGKTGKKIHAGRAGNGSLGCGHWIGMRDREHYRIKGADHFDVPYSQVCARCFGPADEVAARVEDKKK